MVLDVVGVGFSPLLLILNLLFPHFILCLEDGDQEYLLGIKKV